LIFVLITAFKKVFFELLMQSKEFLQSRLFVTKNGLNFLSLQAK